MLNRTPQALKVSLTTTATNVMLKGKGKGRGTRKQARNKGKTPINAYFTAW